MTCIEISQSITTDDNTRLWEMIALRHQLPVRPEFDPMCRIQVIGTPGVGICYINRPSKQDASAIREIASNFERLYVYAWDTKSLSAKVPSETVSLHTVREVMH